MYAQITTNKKGKKTEMKVNLHQMRKLDILFDMACGKFVFPSDYEYTPPIWEESAFWIWEKLRNMKYEDCSICLSEMNPYKEGVTQSVLCGHRFHKSCLAKYHMQNTESVEHIKIDHKEQVTITCNDCPLCK